MGSRYHRNHNINKKRDKGSVRSRTDETKFETRTETGINSVRRKKIPKIWTEIINMTLFILL